MNNELKENIDTIVRDALHMLNHRGITNYSEGDIHNYVQYYVEQYRECSDNMVENLLNQVDVILCTEELGFEEDNNEESLEKLYANWSNIEGLLKRDILIREYLEGISFEIRKAWINSILKKNVKWGGLTTKEEHIQQIRVFDEMYDFTKEELGWKRERIISRSIPAERRAGMEELFQKRNFSVKEIVMFCKNYRKGD